MFSLLLPPVDLILTAHSAQEDEDGFICATIYPIASNHPLLI